MYLEFDPRSLRIRGGDSASALVSWLIERGYLLFAGDQCGGEYERLERFLERMPLKVHCWTNILAMSVEEATSWMEEVARGTHS